MQSHRIGPEAVLVEVDDPSAALALALWARTADLPVIEIVPAARTVLFDGVADPDDLLRRLTERTPQEEASGGAARAADVVELPVRYDGEDLDTVAQRWQVDPAEVVARHTAQEYVVAFCGFAPGFAYLTGLPQEWAVPRLAEPRSAVPAGAVGLAGSFTGVYPRASPGGWQLLGRTEVTLWDQQRPEPALLTPGTRVRFVETP